MNRRTALVAGGTSFSVALTGCLSNMTSKSDIDRQDLPEWPDGPSESDVTTYATHYMEAVGFNERLEQQEGESDSYEELSFSCSGAFEAETSIGYVVMTSCYMSSTVDEGMFGNRYSSHGPVGPHAVLVNQDETIQAIIEHEWQEFIEDAESPYDTRGLTLVNFSSDPQQIEIAISDNSSSKQSSQEAVYVEEYGLDPVTGKTDLGVIEDSGHYTVEASIASETATVKDWEISDGSREPTTIKEDSTLDIALGVYVLPDQSVEIYEISEDRTTTEG